MLYKDIKKEMKRGYVSTFAIYRFQLQSKNDRLISQVLSLTWKKNNIQILFASDGSVL